MTISGWAESVTTLAGTWQYGHSLTGSMAGKECFTLDARPGGRPPRGTSARCTVARFKRSVICIDNTIWHSVLRIHAEGKHNDSGGRGGVGGVEAAVGREFIGVDKGAVQ